MSTQTLIKESVTKVYEDLDRRTKMAQLQENESLLAQLKWLEAMKANNFIWTISAERAARFAYGATLYQRGDKRFFAESPITRQDAKHWYNIQYAGDLPDFALERAWKAKSLDIDSITIHSNEPLPINVFTYKIDPIIIAWHSCPHINFLDSGIRQFNHSIGVVLAIWDFDEEIRLMDQ